MFYKRNIKPNLEKALKRSPVVLLTGARQIGKTTLIKQIAQEKNYTYVTFDDLQSLGLATRDPVGFLDALKKPVILDEIQRAPDILLGIKKDVDENRVPGRYLVTGSANPLLTSQLGNYLVGRMEILEMFPLSQGELSGVTETFIEDIFETDSLHCEPSQILKADLFEKIISGGYPLVQNKSDEERHSWFSSYITTILERDVKEITHITGLTELPLLLQLLASQTSSLFNASELSKISQIPLTTLRRYLALLKSVYLIDFLPPWFTTIGKQLTKSPKLFMVDTGLVADLLTFTADKISTDSITKGRILENFVISELLKQASWAKRTIKKFHYRTLSRIEVDILLEDRAGNLVGIEVKANSTLFPDDFKALHYLQQELGKKFIRGIILYTGNACLSQSRHLNALPISALWAKSER